MANCSATACEVKTADTSRASNSPGVLKIVQDKQWIGVVARTRYAAEQAVSKIEVSWAFEPYYSTKDAIEAITVGNGVVVVIQDEGDATIDSKSERVTGEYRTPLGYHASMEPSVMIADVSGETVTLYASTQNSAFMLSKAAGKPVHLLYTRQQEFQNGHVRPNTHHILHGQRG